MGKTKQIYGKPWEVVGADIFMLNNKTLLYIVDYYRKFPIVKKVAGLPAGDLVQMIKLIYAECGLAIKIASDADTNFTSEIFKKFCRRMNIQQSIKSSYHHQRNGQVEHA